MIVQQHDIIDYYDSKKISCGFVLEVDDRKLKIINESGKEIRISQARVLTREGDASFPYQQSRENQIRYLKEISRIRNEKKNEVDLRELWDIVNPETSEIDINDLAELCFGRESNQNGTSSLLRAILEDKVFFRLADDKITVVNPQQVEQALAQKKKEHERAEFAAVCAQFLTDLKNDKLPDHVPPPDGLVALLEEGALKGSDWTDVKDLKNLFSKAGFPSNWDPFTVLVKLGVWNEDENVLLRSHAIPVQFSREALHAATVCSTKPLAEHGKDVTGLQTITIDAATTLDIDDALSLTMDGDMLTLGIHITDAAHFVERDSLLDREVQERAISLYLPDLIIPMLPPVLSEHAASLVSGQVRPVISVMARFNRQWQLEAFEVTPGLIKVKERLTYEDIDSRILNESSPENLMFELATHLRMQRLRQGALVFKDPEINVRVTEDKTIEVRLRDREACSQILVSEFMIFANSLFAKYLQEKRVPAIYRTQAPPAEKIEIKEEYDPVESYRCKKNLTRGDFVTKPAPHSTLGLPAYTTATSPLRRYTDLVVQRQIRATLGLPEDALGEVELQKVLTEISFRIDRASVLERQRQRYFILKYLSQMKNAIFDAIVLQRFPRFYLVYLCDFGFNAALKLRTGIDLNPYDRVAVTIDKIVPREEKLTLSLPGVT